MSMKPLATSVGAQVLMSQPTSAGDAPTIAVHPDIPYTAPFIQEGKPLASPTVTGRFGQDVRIEVSDLMRVEFTPRVFVLSANPGE